jgi:hypothetical protein
MTFSFLCVSSAELTLEVLEFLELSVELRVLEHISLGEVWPGLLLPESVETELRVMAQVLRLGLRFETVLGGGTGMLFSSRVIDNFSLGVEFGREVWELMDLDFRGDLLPVFFCSKMLIRLVTIMMRVYVWSSLVSVGIDGR